MQVHLVREHVGQGKLAGARHTLRSSVLVFLHQQVNLIIADAAGVAADGIALSVRDAGVVETPPRDLKQ
jgi:hypothetical protein